MVTDLDVDACEALCRSVRETGGQALALQLDVTSAAQWAAAVQAVQERWSILHILVNNAGIGRRKTVVEESQESWDEVIAVSQTGTWLGMKHAGPLIEASGGGSIVNVSSIFGATGGFGSHFSYHAAKGAVRLMTKSAALHWAVTGVRVNSVHPGFIDSPATVRNRGQDPTLYRAMLDATPMLRLGSNEEVAACIAFLSSDDASFMTGSELYVDGGYTAR